MNRRTGTLRRIQNIEHTLLQIEGVVGKLRRQILELDQHYHNRIAAHKAHVTMAKRGKGVSRKVAKDAKKTVRHKIEIGGA